MISVLKSKNVIQKKYCYVQQLQNIFMFNDTLILILILI